MEARLAEVQKRLLQLVLVSLVLALVVRPDTGNHRYAAALSEVETFRAGFVQREAEDAFVSTASTLRGVRAGATTLRDQVEDGVIADLDGEEDEESFEETEESHGDDGETQSEWRERPRVRPRTSERA